MSFRAFGTRTQAGTPQPMFGTTLTAAVTPTPPIVGQWVGTPALGDTQTVLPVTDATVFQVGDRVGLGTLATFGDPRTLAAGTPQIDYARVTAVNIAGETITVQGLLKPHGNGEFVVLCIPFANLNLNGGAANMYVGTDSSVGAASKTLLFIVGPTGNYSLGAGVNINAHETNQLWTLGNAADTYLPSLVII